MAKQKRPRSKAPAGARRRTAASPNRAKGPVKEPAIPNSGCTGIHWPATPGPSDAMLLALQHQLEQSQWWPAETLLVQQLRQAELLLTHAARTVPFYAGRLKAVSGLGAGDLTLETFRRLPLLSRTDIQDAGDALTSRRTPKDHGAVADSSTSGSTGRPLTVKSTALTAMFLLALNLRYHLWHGRDFSGRAAAIRSLQGDMAKAAETGATLPWVPGYPTGPMSFLPVATPIRTQFEWLVRQDPDYLLTPPSNLRALLERSQETGVRPSRLRDVTTMAEMLGPDVRGICERVWGVPLNDIYSAQEVGLIALQCPGHTHYHVQAESVLVEVLDDDGDPCRPGAVGRLVVTDLHNFATPLIRYDIGDYAEAGAPCPCGRGLGVLNRVVGRSRNMLTLPNGDRQFPYLPSEPLTTLAPIRQFQVIQHSIREIEVKLVMPRPLTADEEAGLCGYFTDNFGHPFAFTFTYVDEIPRNPGGKHEEVISRVGT